MSDATMSRRTFLEGVAAGGATVAALAGARGAIASESADSGKSASATASTASTPTYEGTYDVMSQFSTYAHGENPDAVAPATAQDYITAKGDGVLSAGGMVDQLGITPADFMLNVPAWLQTAPEIPASQVADTTSCDVLVIGAGNAGTVAALRCAEAGLDVILAETQTYDEYDEYACDMACYNNSLFLAKGTPELDTMEVFNEYMRLYRGHAHEKLVRDYATRSGEMFDWMLNYIPQEYVDNYAKTSNYKGNASYDGQSCGSYSFRGMVQWRDEDSNVNMWPFVIRSLHSAIEDKGGTIKWGWQAIELVKDGDTVTGALLCDVDGTYHRVEAKDTIVCAGDFGGNPDMRLDLSDQMRNLAWSYGKDRTDADNTSGMGRDGSGIKMCLWAGATMEAGPRAGQAAGCNSAPEGFAFGGAWPCFGSDGKRFFNESLIKHGTYGFLDMLPKGSLFLQVTDSNWEEYLTHQGYGHETMDRSSDYMVAEVHQNMADYVTGPDGFPVRCFARFGKEYLTCYAADTLEEVAQIAGLDEEATQNFLAEVQHWNEMCEAGKDTDWGIDPQLLLPIKDAPFFFAFSSSSDNASGGLCQHAAVCTDGRYQVLTGSKAPIQGLYAAGNTCGQRIGIQYATPTAGNSCGSALTSGYCAAESVIADLA
ncbi:MAG: FAD-binding protein [Coriobacteriales bacterium]|jgi:fumarate reductase flavoprotein subunit